MDYDYNLLPHDEEDSESREMQQLFEEIGQLLGDNPPNSYSSSSRFISESRELREDTLHCESGLPSDPILIGGGESLQILRPGEGLVYAHGSTGTEPGRG